MASPSTGPKEEAPRADDTPNTTHPTPPSEPLPLSPVITILSPPASAVSPAPLRRTQSPSDSALDSIKEPSPRPPLPDHAEDPAAGTGLVGASVARPRSADSVNKPSASAGKLAGGAAAAPPTPKPAPPTPGKSESSNSLIGSLFSSAEKKHPVTTVTRLPTLPPKSEEEELKHRKEYESMLADYRKKAEKEKEQKQKARLKREDRKIKARQFWNAEIFANWDKLKGTKKVKDQCWSGVPPSVRGKVWPLAIGNELHITTELYTIFLGHARKARDSGLGKEDTVQLIPLDLPRTFPLLSFFSAEGPQHSSLRKVLEAYVCYRPDVGYVQGMSYIAAMFLLYMEEYDAFRCMANLLNKPLFLSFYRMDLAYIDSTVKIVDVLFTELLPKLHGHFVDCGIRMDMFLIDWVLTLFTKALPVDAATHIWDAFFIEGDIMFFKAVLGLLSLRESILEDLNFEGIIKSLTRLQDVDEDELFEEIETISNYISTIRFNEIYKICMASPTP